MSPHSRLARGVTLLLLFWLGLDLGAHGLFPSDFQLMTATTPSVGGVAASDSATDPSHDHCFYHNVSPAATLSLLGGRCERSNPFVSIVSFKVLFSAERPQDHPPKTLA
jgi:hypothetical protein